MKKILPHILTTTLSALVSFLAVSTLLVTAIGPNPTTPSGEQDGGIYAHYLRAILGVPAVTDYYLGNPSGGVSVRNTDRLGNLPSTTFQRKITADLCPVGQYLIGIDSAGGLNCTTGGGNYCSSPLPVVNNATFTYGATSANQAWVRNATSCGFTCNAGYTWQNGPSDCIADPGAPPPSLCGWTEISHVSPPLNPTNPIKCSDPEPICNATTVGSIFSCIDGGTDEFTSRCSCSAPPPPPSGDCDIQWYMLPSGPTNDTTILPGTTRNFTGRGFTYIGSDLIKVGDNFTCPAAPPPSSGCYGPVNTSAEALVADCTTSVAGLIGIGYTYNPGAVQGASCSAGAIVDNACGDKEYGWRVCNPTHCPAPTCTDGVQNGTETGIDCGGSCGACVPPPSSGCDFRYSPCSTCAIIDGSVSSGVNVSTVGKYNFSPGTGLNYVSPNTYLCGSAPPPPSCGPTASITPSYPSPDSGQPNPPTTGLCSDGSTPPVTSTVSKFSWTCGAGAGAVSCSVARDCIIQYRANATSSWIPDGIPVGSSMAIGKTMLVNISGDSRFSTADEGTQIRYTCNSTPTSATTCISTTCGVMNPGDTCDAGDGAAFGSCSSTLIPSDQGKILEYCKPTAGAPILESCGLACTTTTGRDYWNGGGGGMPKHCPALATPTAPGTPTGLSGTPGNTSVSLTWGASTGSPTSYTIQYKRDTENWGAASTVTLGNVTSGTVTGLTNGIVWNFRVRASNASGTNSNWSTVINVTPVASGNKWALQSCTCMPSGTTSLGNNMTGYEDYLLQNCPTVGQTMLAGAQDYCGGLCPVGSRGIATLRCGGSVTQPCLVEQAVGSLIEPYVPGDVVYDTFLADYANPYRSWGGGLSMGAVRMRSGGNSSGWGKFVVTTTYTTSRPANVPGCNFVAPPPPSLGCLYSDGTHASGNTGRGYMGLTIGTTYPAGTTGYDHMWCCTGDKVHKWATMADRLAGTNYLGLVSQTSATLHGITCQPDGTWTTTSESPFGYSCETAGIGSPLCGKAK